MSNSIQQPTGDQKTKELLYSASSQDLARLFPLLRLAYDYLVYPVTSFFITDSVKAQAANLFRSLNFFSSSSTVPQTVDPVVLASFNQAKIEAIDEFLIAVIGNPSSDTQTVRNIPIQFAGGSGQHRLLIIPLLEGAKNILIAATFSELSEVACIPVVSGHLEALKWLVENVHLDLNHVVDVITNSGHSLAYLATIFGHLHILQYLGDHGVRMDRGFLRDSDCARRSGHPTLLHFFQSKSLTHRAEIIPNRNAIPGFDRVQALQSVHNWFSERWHALSANSASQPLSPPSKPTPNVTLHPSRLNPAF